MCRNALELNDNTSICLKEAQLLRLFIDNKQSEAKMLMREISVIKMGYKPKKLQQTETIPLLHTKGIYHRLCT